MVAFSNPNLFLPITGGFLFLFLFFYHLNNKHYKNNKFKIYIEIITAVSTLILALGVLFQVISYKMEQDKNAVQNITSFSKDYIDSIIEMFTQHPEMDYYYNELFNGSMHHNYHGRNLVLENQISMRIFAKTIEQISIVDAHENVESAHVLKETLIKILRNFLKSASFKNFYLQHYKPRLAGPLIMNFMQEHFGL